MLAFASEIKSLLQHPEIPRELDPDGLALFLTYDYVPYPYSIFKGIQKLPPASLLRYQHGKIAITRYWNLDFSPQAMASAASEDALISEFRTRMTQAVAYRLESDVPLGVFLSGGLDSSFITALMCTLRPPSTVKTFSIHFDDASFDESRYSTQVARHLGTEHHAATFHSRELCDLIPSIAEMMDEPFADASLFPTYLLSRFARSQVTVALSGDGSDELLAGYPTFYARKVATYYRQLPQCLQRLAALLIRRLPTSTGYMSLDFKLKQFIAGTHETGARQQQAWLSGFLPHELDALFSPEFSRLRTRPDPYQLIDAEMKHCHAKDDLDRDTYFYSKFYLAEDILTKSDRASMANSLELRAPFLDKDVAAFVTRLPTTLRLKGSTGKYLLKRAADGLLPPEIIHRSKQGFGVPIAHWFRHQLKSLLADHLQGRLFRESGIFNGGYVDRLLEEHWRGTHDHRKKLFPLLMVAIWQEAAGKEATCQHHLRTVTN